MNYEEYNEQPEFKLSIPRLNSLTFKCKTVEFGTGRVKKEWTEQVTWFMFFDSFMDVN
jgi:hypothetical protein